MSILCTIDLSPCSATAINAAIAIARARGDREVVVVHAIDADENPQRAARKINDAERALNDVLATAVTTVADMPAIRPIVLMGAIVDTLTAIGESENADLVVICARRADHGTSRTLGSTAEALATRTTLPLLIVRDAAPFVAWADGVRSLRALVGIDDSPISDLAVALLATSRTRRAIDLTLAAVYYSDESARHYGMPVTSAVDANPECESLIARDLATRFANLGGIGAVTHVAVRGLGRPADHLIEAAERANADVIVIGTHRATGLSRLGSVSVGVVHDATVSVLCVPPEAARTLATAIPRLNVVVVATDDSAFANRAVPYGAALALAPEGSLHLVHVVRDDEPRDESTDAALRADLLSRLPTAVRSRATAHIIAGDDIAESIASTAARLGADVICVASHIRGGVTRALVGSVADRILRITRIPVLVLRPKLD